MPMFHTLNDSKNSRGNKSIFIDTQSSIILVISILIFISLFGCYFVYIMLLPNEFVAPENSYLILYILE
jgi:hypothetical protein